jgi:iron complex transport system ATP-binding protein
METAAHIISLEDFSIGYLSDSPLLEGLNLSVERGEMVALIGRNGTGKSTLIKSMIGLLAPLGGNCKLDGRAFHAHSRPERARLVSYVSSQLTRLPSLTVGELVALGRMPHTGWMGRLDERDLLLVKEALEEVQLSSFEERKLDCLSDGECQRAMIARALVQDTPLMVLDEPTAFLDIPNTYDLVRLLSRFRDSGKSVVYSTHDLETAMQCADKLWVIHGGEILEGAPEDLGISGLFSKLFASSGISYEEDSGKFLFNTLQKGTVQLEGDDEQLMSWTRNTLKRLGYVVDNSSAVLMTVEHVKEKVQWRVEKSGSTHMFRDLYQLARFLN